MLRVAIIGCGKIADAHVSQIRRVRGSSIVGVCDAEALMAKQLARRAGVDGCFSRVSDLLADARPDVVHITTPPASHFDLAMQCIEAGCHVYVEKPLTLNAGHARTLLSRASERNLKLTVGHDDQFTRVTRRMRELIGQGFLGGQPLHMESHYCYELGSDGYARALLGDREHWVRKLPGQLFQNVISHGIARIAEFMTSGRPRVLAHAFTSPALSGQGEAGIQDELRVIVQDQGGVTAYFTFSSQFRPSLHQFRIYGARNGLMLDHDQQTLIRLRGERRKSYLEKFLSPLDLAFQYAANARENLALFAASDFHMKSGMKFLIEAFYRSIADDAPLPIPHKEILVCAQMMDDIFAQIARPAFLDAATRVQVETIEE